MLRQRVITALILAPCVIFVILWVPHPITVAVLALLVAAGPGSGRPFPALPMRRPGWPMWPSLRPASGWPGMSASIASNRALLLYASLAWWVLALLWIAFAPASVNRGDRRGRWPVRAGAGLAGAGPVACRKRRN